MIAELAAADSSSSSSLPGPTPAERRNAFRRNAPIFRGPVDRARLDLVDTVDIVLDGPDGRGIKARTYYSPEHAVLSRADVIVYFHGGGWVAGDLESYDDDMRYLAMTVGGEVVSVEYRLAPENPFPAALEDCVAAARAVASRAGIRSLSLAGDSAGGNLALSTALSLAGSAVHLDALLLLYPVVDRDAQANDSYRANGRGFLLEATDMAYFWSVYESASAQRLLDQSLEGLPPTVLTTAGFDPLRDEGRALAEALIRADVPLIYLPNPMLTHGFQQMVPRVPAAHRAVDRAYQALVHSLT
ncbi:hypothetical protein AX769_00930 [Frondihabitans sp. PAMC 28766]|nr:hypothetical protein AX769_00930 [Frondihabitans sp. PAMC 28766]